MLRLEHQLVHLALLVGRLADHERAGHVGVVAVDEGADVDDHGVALDDRRVARSGGAGGRALSGRWRRSSRSSARRRRAGACGARARRGRRPRSAVRRASARTAASASSAIAAAALDPGHLAVVLHAPQRSSTVPLVGTQVEVAGEVGPGGVGEVRRLGAAPGPAPAALDEPLAELAAGSSRRRPRRRRPAAASSAAARSRVAAVGDEHQLVGPHHDPAVRAAEAGQPADVRRGRDEQRVAVERRRRTASGRVV